ALCFPTGTAFADIGDRVEMANETRQVLEVAPEVIDLFKRSVHNARSLRMNSVVVVGELHGANHVERSDREHIRRCERHSAALCLRSCTGNTETDEIDCVSGNTRPHRFSRILLSKNSDPCGELTQTVQSY